MGALLHFPSNETQLILPRDEDRREEEKRIGEEEERCKEGCSGVGEQREKKKGGEETQEEIL